MAVSPTLRRLMKVLAMEEEQRRLELESGLGQLAQLKHALALTVERDRAGRQMVAESACTGELHDRLAGIEETCIAERQAAVLKPRIAEAEVEVMELRQEFIAKQIERRQAEALVEKAEVAEALEEAKRSQRMLDDRYLNQFHGAEHNRGAEQPIVFRGSRLDRDVVAEENR